MTAPPATDWAKQYEKSSDQRLWDSMVENARDWEEDFAHHSMQNVMDEVLTHRGLIPVSPHDVFWRIIEAMFPNTSSKKSDILAEIATHPDRQKAAEAALVKAFAACVNRGQRVVTGLFVHETGTPYRTYAEMHVLDPIIQMSRAATARQSMMAEGFCRAFTDATGLRPEQAEMCVQRGLVSGESTTLGERTLYSERIWFQPRKVQS